MLKLLLLSPTTIPLIHIFAIKVTKFAKKFNLPTFVAPIISKLKKTYDENVSLPKHLDPHG